MPGAELEALPAQALLEAAPDAMIVVGPDGRVVYANGQALLLFGYAAGELDGQPVELLVPEELRDGHVIHRGRYAQHPNIRPGDRAGQRKNGEVFPAEIRLSPLGQTMVMAVIRDVSGRLQIEQDLAAANKALQSFDYSVAHDLMAPIRIMASFAALIQSRYSALLDKDGREFLQHIIEGGVTATQLVQGLLSLSRVSQTAIIPTWVNLSDLAAHQAQDLRGLHPDRQVSVSIQPGLKGWIDPRLAISLMQNLMSNSWKFTAKVAQAVIEVGFADGEFFVRDNGVGFDPALAEKLFIPFERLHGEAFKGYGVGLAICFRILQRHGGTIRASNRPGGGAMFSFTLPEPAPHP